VTSNLLHVMLLKRLYQGIGLFSNKWGSIGAVSIHWTGILDWTTGLTQNGVKFAPLAR